ncbi:MAG TPA: hypothetical protein VMZ91_13450 [Candidatus Paceibacterota bacterium]|nr:hypothetical protein [Candidatus Paceibacterota bacterium]
MVNRKITNCFSCRKLQRTRTLRKVNGNFFCSSCYHKNLQKHRKETIEKAGIKNELEELDKKRKKEWDKKHYNLKIKPFIRKYIKNSKNLTQNTSKSFYEPFVKSPKTKKKPKSNSWITLEERRFLLRIIMNKGLNFEEAKERVREIIIEQARIREIMREQGKSEEQIKIKQKEMLEELWKI